MKYTGTIEQVLAFEDAVIATGNYTRIKDGKRPTVSAPGHAPMTAYYARYEVYLSDEAAPLSQNPDKWFYLISFPHVGIRINTFQRDNTGEVKISPRKLPKLLAKYPQLTDMLAAMEYKDNPYAVYAGKVA